MHKFAVSKVCAKNQRLFVCQLIQLKFAAHFCWHKISCVAVLFTAAEDKLCCKQTSKSIRVNVASKKRLCV